MINHVLYKQFAITIRANLDGSPGKFDIVYQIRRVEDRVEDRTSLIHSRFISKEFNSEKAAYEFGLQEARIYIDEQAVGE